MAEALRAEMNRSLAMYYSNLGTIYATKNMSDEAEAEFRRALDVFPHDVLALFNLGRVYADKKKYMEAKDYYERLVEITPDDPIAWYNLAGSISSWIILRSRTTTRSTWAFNAICGHWNWTRNIWSRVSS